MSDMTQLWHSYQDSVTYISGNTDKNKNNHKNLYDFSLADKPIGAINICRKKKRNTQDQRNCRQKHFYIKRSKTLL
jgi:hypothetical protein